MMKHGKIFNKMCHVSMGCLPDFIYFLNETCLIWFVRKSEALAAVQSCSSFCYFSILLYFFTFYQISKIKSHSMNRITI